MGRDTEFLKRQYENAMEIWQEKAAESYIIFCENHDEEPEGDVKELLCIIAKFKADAFAAGIDGLKEFNAGEKLCEAFEDVPPIGAEFFDVIYNMVHESYLDGVNARKRWC